ncbi:MAG TPA: serine/threonine-protein kinase, partial [Polyangium sp.]|nr:serine/threonine-protein kinase [Polyangium sp.]
MTTGVPAPAQPANWLESGRILGGKFRIQRRLGAGGMGVVVAATHVFLKKQVALKVLTDAAAAHPDAKARFLREARAAANIENEHVARVMDVGTFEDGSPYILMEFLEGKDLLTLLTDGGPLPIQLAIDYVLQACEAIAEAHLRGIVHRDIKPANLFLAQRTDESTCIKVLDFGISKLTPTNVIGIETLPVETGIAWGSPQYMSPEQIRASADMDGRTDVWSLGVTLFQLLTRRLPFHGINVQQISAAVLEQPFPSVCAYRAEVPVALDRILQKCCAKNPAHRWANIAEFAGAVAFLASNAGLASVERIAAIQRKTLPPLMTVAPTTPPLRQRSYALKAV